MFARLLRISSTQTLPSDSTSNSSVLVSQTNPHCTYCNKLSHTRDRCYQLHGRPQLTAHMAQSSDSQPPQPPSSSTSQGILPTDSEYNDYLRYQAAKSAFVASVAQPIMHLPVLLIHLLFDLLKHGLTVLVPLFKNLACFAVQQTIQFSIIITLWGSVFISLFMWTTSSLQAVIRMVFKN